MGHTNINQKAAIGAEMAVEAMATAAAMAEAHTTINQKAAAIVAEMVVEEVAMAAAVAEAKIAAEAAAAMSHQQLWHRWGQAMVGADNNQPKSGRNGS
jgi:hypothetical protein